MQSRTVERSVRGPCCIGVETDKGRAFQRLVEPVRRVSGTATRTHVRRHQLLRARLDAMAELVSAGAAPWHPERKTLHVSCPEDVPCRGQGSMMSLYTLE